MKRVCYLVTAGPRAASYRTSLQLTRPRILHFSTAQHLRKDDNSAKDGGPIDHAVDEAKELQARTPWHRDGSDKPPVKRPRSAGAMTKGLLF